MPTHKLCSSRSILVLACVALASLCCAAQASADDTFTMENHSRLGLNSPHGSICATGAFTEGGGEIEPGETATVTLSRTLLTECDGTFEISGGTSYGGQWKFEPDDPTVGEASLECSVEGEPANYIEMHVSGLTCTATNIEKNLAASAGPGGTIECTILGKEFGPCASSYPYPYNVTLKAIPDHGKYFKEWQGTGSAAGCGTSFCSFSLEEDSTVNAVFGPRFPLTVAKSGHGTVTSTPSGIACSVSSCTAEFDGEKPISLTATADAGYEFAGWIGCPGAEPTCEITLEAASEVKAIFLKAPAQGEKGEQGERGAQGETGATGATGATGTTGATGATGEKGAQGEKGAKGETGTTGEKGATGAGGVKGENGATGGTGAQGETGATGATGATGKEGAKGLEGVQGETGATGETGTQGGRGANGATGQTGPAGPTGATGPAGSRSVVKLAQCVIDSRHKHQWTCTTKPISSSAKVATRGAAQDAILSRGRAVYATGIAYVADGYMSMRLTILRALSPGRYAVTLQRGGGRQTIISVESVTIAGP